MKKIAVVLFVIFITGSPALAERFYGNTGYERRVRVACEQATKHGGRINTPAAKKCFYDVVDLHREQNLTDSQIRLNNAKAEWFERHKNKLDYRGFPCEN